MTEVRDGQGGFCMRPRLRLFTGDDDAALSTDARQVTMKFSEFFQVVAGVPVQADVAAGLRR